MTRQPLAHLWVGSTLSAERLDLLSRFQSHVLGQWSRQKESLKRVQALPLSIVPFADLSFVVKSQIDELAIFYTQRLRDIPPLEFRPHTLLTNARTHVVNLILKSNSRISGMPSPWDQFQRTLDEGYRKMGGRPLFQEQDVFLPLFTFSLDQREDVIDITQRLFWVGEKLRQVPFTFSTVGLFDLVHKTYEPLKSFKLK